MAKSKSTTPTVIPLDPEFSPLEKFVFSWIDAASPELKAEFVFMETTRAAGEGTEKVKAWLHEHEPSGIQHDTTVCGFDEIILPRQRWNCSRLTMKKSSRKNYGKRGIAWHENVGRM